jgi:hypothetical protein
LTATSQRQPSIATQQTCIIARARTWQKPDLLGLLACDSNLLLSNFFKLTAAQAVSVPENEQPAGRLE